MTPKGFVTLATIFVAALGVLYLSGSHRQWKQPRVYIDAKEPAPPPGQTPSKEQAGASVNWAEYFGRDCPHMALLPFDKDADYTIDVVGSLAIKRWIAFVGRSDSADIYRGQEQDPHAILKQSCAAIRADVEDWAGFGSVAAKTKAVPTGRYAFSYHPANPNYAFLLDTKTGAVWELTHHSTELIDRKGTGQKFTVTWRTFDRVSVGGLYTSIDEQDAEFRAVENSGGSEEQKKERHKRDEENRESELQKEAAKDQQ